MDQPLTESEIDKIIERLNYSNQTDGYAQTIFMEQTKAIRQQHLADERIIHALKAIFEDKSNRRAQVEAKRTLDDLGVATRPLPGQRVNLVDSFLLGFFGWFILGSLYAISMYDFPYYVFGVITIIALGVLFMNNMNKSAYGILAAILLNAVLVIPFMDKLDLRYLLFAISIPGPAWLYLFLSNVS